LNFARPHFSSTQSPSSEVSATSSPSVSRTISKSLRALSVRLFSLPEHATWVRIPTSRSVALSVSEFPFGQNVAKDWNRRAPFDDALDQSQTAKQRSALDGESHELLTRIPIPDL
jgi:hypothetical protein